MSLATYSRDLKVFSAEDEYSLPVSVSVTTRNPTHGRITWSGDGKWLSVAPLDHGGGPLPIFKYSNKQLHPLKYITLSNIRSASFFNWTNRNIAVGNESGEIFVWDIKDKKIAVKVEYIEKHPVDLIAINSDDTYLASASLITNKICLHGLKTNKVVNTICLPKSKQTSSLKFCLCKKNYLGASSIESTICVWDITRSEFIFKIIQAHTGACTDISFSPINYDVIASVSLTKTLKLYDIREKKSILDVNLGEPLNCVDIILNGDKVAAGTTGGSVIIYDLRADKVLQTFKAHEGPIFSVKTQNLKIAKSYKEIEMNTPDTIEIPSKTLDISVMDVFSPIIRPNEKDNLLTSSNQFKFVPSQSTTNLELNNTDSPSPYDDSFLRKVMSPVLQQKSMYLIPTSQSSPYLLPISEASDAVVESETRTNLANSIKKEIPSIIGPGGDNATGFQVDNATERNMYYSDVISEIRTCHQAILNEIGLVRREVNEIKNNFENRFKVLEENCESLKKLLVDDIKQEIYFGNCDSKMEHSCQRILINELNESILASEEKLNAEIHLNALRLMHIYEAVKGTK